LLINNSLYEPFRRRRQQTLDNPVTFPLGAVLNRVVLHVNPPNNRPQTLKIVKRQLGKQHLGLRASKNTHFSPKLREKQGKLKKEARQGLY
jgi:hypothetical protein